MDMKQIYDLAKEMAILEQSQKEIRSRVKAIRSLLDDFQLEGKPDEGTLSGKIVTYLQSRGGPIAVKDIADGVRGKRASVNASLWKLSKEGLLSKAGRGYYVAKAS